MKTLKRSFRQCEIDLANRLGLDPPTNRTIVDFYFKVGLRLAAKQPEFRGFRTTRPGRQEAASAHELKGRVAQSLRNDVGRAGCSFQFGRTSTFLLPRAVAAYAAKVP
jgi:hypothetical protein